MKNVIFLFAPLLPASSIGPYLAPHLLSTILRKEGFNVQNLDLNRAFVDEIADPQLLKEIRDEFDRDLLEIDTMPKEKLKQLKSAIGHVNLLISNLEKNIVIEHQQKVILCNSLVEFFMDNLRTVDDYVKNGLATIPPVKKLFYKLLDQFDIEGKTICMSCAFGNQLPFTLETARYFRSKSKNVKIILGGAQISLLPPEVVNEIKDLKLFNVFFSGFAEEKIAEVIRQCPEDFFSEVTYGSVATSKMLDAIPYTDFDELDKYAVLRIPVLVNKGCYWGKCSFCDYILMGDLGGFRYISRSVDIVYDEIKKIRERIPNSYVNLISDAVPPKFYKELCERANQDNFELRTSAYMINNKNLTEEFFKEASKAKIGIIVFGTESTNDRVLELMQKQGRREDILRNLEHAKKYNVPVKVNLIPNYPTTTFEEALQTYQDIWQFEDTILSLAVFKFYLSANTKMDQDPEDYNLEVNNEVPYLRTQHNGFHSRDFKTKVGMTAQEEKKIYEMFYDLAFNISLNPARFYFREEFEKKQVESLQIKQGLNFFPLGKQLAFYSQSRGRTHVIRTDDIALITELSEKKKTIKDVMALKGEHAKKWLEEYYALELFEFIA
ncbi:MAG: radical SAM protein [Bacteriovoracaceae bacterium]|nr:radical SAM protein [Bacteriovoracaceae bacterium]